MAKKDPWYIPKRAESLAMVVLTRRSDIEVTLLPENSRPFGYDILVQRRVEGLDEIMRLGIRTEGTTSDRLRVVPGKPNTVRVIHHVEPAPPADLPLCVLLFTVDDEKGFYRWLYEPVVNTLGQPELRPDRARLPAAQANGRGRQVALDFSTLDDAVIGRLLEQANGWFRALRKGAPALCTADHWTGAAPSRVTARSDS